MEMKTLTINGKKMELPGADSVSFKPQALNKEEKAQARANIEAVKQNDYINYSVYFDIDANGLVSLKEEYRGDTTELYALNYPFSKSDNGLGVEGSKINELPERIIIPNNIDGEEVTGFQWGIFCCNKRVKEITIPPTVKKIPKGFVREAIHLEKVINTEQIEEIENVAFGKTRIREMICPNLTMLGSKAFSNDSCLVRVDLGKITEIKGNTFEFCENLAEVKADNVTSIGNSSFYGTRRLKTIPFQANVKSIGVAAFWNSRCDLESLPAYCTFGDMACYKQFNTPDNEYWKGVAFTPRKNPLGSLFYQKDPKWAKENIIWKNKADNGHDWIFLTADDSGNKKPCTYGGNGCALFVLIEIYSALKKKLFNSPQEFFDYVGETHGEKVFENFEILEDGTPTDIQITYEYEGITYNVGKDFRQKDPWCAIANGLGLQIERFATMDAIALKKVYDALADGALICKSVAGVYTAGDPETAWGGHSTVAYGINSDGEMLISDTSMHCNEVGIYENHKTAWHIYKHGSKECECIIVKEKSV